MVRFNFIAFDDMHNEIIWSTEVTAKEAPGLLELMSMADYIKRHGEDGDLTPYRLKWTEFKPCDGSFASVVSVFVEEIE